MPQVGKETLVRRGSSDRHPHILLPRGRTSTANGHSHTWNGRRNKTSFDNGHDHDLPPRDKNEVPKAARKAKSAPKSPPSDAKRRVNAKPEKRSEPEGLQDEE